MKRLLIAAAVLFGIILGASPKAEAGGTAPSSRADATPPRPASASQDGGVTMMFVADPQFPWWNGIDNESIIPQSRAAISRMISAMDNIQRLGHWPTDLAVGGGSPVDRPAGVIINGDLTAFFHKWQFLEYLGAFHVRITSRNGFPVFSPPPHQVYPGLGNHDYKNNVTACSGTWGFEYFGDPNRCAKEAVWWMANLTRSLPNVVNRDLSGFVTVKNSGGFVARFSVDYADGGARAAQVTDVFEVLQSRTLVIPKTDTDIRVKIEVHTGFNWRTAQDYLYSTPRAACLDLSGTTFDTEVAAVGCHEWPTGSNGSLSYSFDIGDYHFVQLQYRPDYEVNLSERTVLNIFGGPSPGFHVTKSYDWLRADLAAATAAGKNIVINMHDVTGGDCVERDARDELPANWNPCNPAGTSVKNDSAFRAAIAGQSVVAIFAGHVHQSFGRVVSDPPSDADYVINGDYKIPIFHSSSADCERFLLADFHRRHFNVAAVSSAAGFPLLVTNFGVLCRAGFIGENNKSDTRPRTFFINRPPSVSGALATSPAREGAALSFNASGSDPDGDPLTYTWNFGDGSAPVTGQNVTHVYADNKTATSTDDKTYYEVKVTARDDFEGEAVYTFQVTVANVAPVITTGPGPTIDENQTATINITISDPGVRDTFTLTIDWKDGNADTFYPAAGTTSYSHKYLDDDPTGTPSDAYAVLLYVEDKDGGSGSALSPVAVRNVNPTVVIDSIVDKAGQVVESFDSVLVGLPIASRESYADVGTQDARTATRNWGDLTPTENLGPVTSGTSGSHVYKEEGTYRLTLVVTDDDTGVGTISRALRVVTPVGATTDAIAALSPITSTQPAAARALRDALAALNGQNGGQANSGALDKLANGNNNAALRKLEHAIQYLETAEASDPALDFTKLKSLLALTAKSVAVEAIARAEAGAPNPGQRRQLEATKASLAQGQLLLNDRQHAAAAGAFREAL